MTSGFQIFADPFGNLWCADGYVAQLKNGVRLPVGSGAEFSGVLADARGVFTPAAATSSGTFVGGSGRGLISTGITPTGSGPAVPVGLWRPARPGVYVLGKFTLLVTGPSAATISDGPNTVAILSAGGTAPVGAFLSTSYGQTTYNGGTVFTLTLLAEQGAPGTIQTYSASVSDGTGFAGVFAAVTAVTWQGATDANWMVVVNTDGTADLMHAGTIMASRSAAGNCDASGVYEANATGMAAYNSGAAWRAYLQVIPVAPRAGFVYVKVSESAGVLTSVAGPFLATALPSNTTTDFYVPLALSDGLGGLLQIHTGLLLWQSPIATATALQTPRTINGVAFDGTSNITVAAAAGTLQGTTLNSSVITSSLTSVGNLAMGTWSASVIGGAYGGTGVSNPGRTLTLAGNFALSGSYNTTFLQTGSTTVILPSTSSTMARTDSGQTFAGAQTFTGKVSGTGQGTTAGLGANDFTTRSLAAAEWLFNLNSHRLVTPAASSVGWCSVAGGGSIYTGFSNVAISIAALAVASSCSSTLIYSNMETMAAWTGQCPLITMDMAFAFQAYIAIGAGSNCRLRLMMGGALPQSAQYYANADPLTTRGFGAEFYWSTTNSRTEVRLFGHNGTTISYTTGVPYTSSGFTSNGIILAKTGTNLSLYWSSAPGSRPTLLTSMTIDNTAGVRYSYYCFTAVVVGSSAAAVPAGGGIEFNFINEVRYLQDSGL